MQCFWNSAEKHMACCGCKIWKVGSDNVEEKRGRRRGLYTSPPRTKKTAMLPRLTVLTNKSPHRISIFGFRHSCTFQSSFFERCICALAEPFDRRLLLLIKRLPSLFFLRYLWKYIFSDHRITVKYVERIESQLLYLLTSRDSKLSHLSIHAPEPNRFFLREHRLFTFRRVKFPYFETAQHPTYPPSQPIPPIIH
jgi:hypothetical protein